MNSWNTLLAKHYNMYAKPAPCDDCSQRQKCKEELLACDVFKAYVMRNQHWMKKRVPNRKIWNDIFLNDKDEEEENGARKH